MKKSSKAINITSLVMAALAHLSVIVLVFLSYRYFQIEMKTFMSVIGAVICLLIVIDILFFVGAKYRDRRIKIATIILATFIALTGFTGSFAVSKVNKTVDSVIDNAGTDQFETVGGVFVCYQKDSSSKQYNELSELKGLKVGVLTDSGIGTGTMAQQLLEKEGVSVSLSRYNTTDELLSALVEDETNVNGVDVAVFPSSYRQRLANDDNVDYGQYLEKMTDFYSFEEKVKTGENKNANKDLSGEPFNILLIGFAPENEAMTYGLADSIIVASVNPQSLTVSMTSIARDSYVPISCYGGASEKINAARGTSRACLMETVGDVLDMEIDFYMEVNFRGVVEIVNAIGGITINNPVTFVGQSASSNRGEYTVLVPAGEEVPADGDMALAFARERHAMPNGDFDRQQHQQEVIAEIVRGLLNMRDVNSALKVMEAAGENISTNLSLSQLTGVFNYLINIKSNTGMPVFNMIDIQNMRVTGYASWTYNRSMRLPLWIYKLYNGSIKEAKNRVKDVLNEYDINAIPQDPYMTFMAKYPYSRGPLYSTVFNEAQVHEEMPAFYPYLTKYTYEQALSWAASNGVSLNVSFISEDSPNYNASQHGMVIAQEPRQGALVEEWRTGSITVMGSMDPNYVPTFTVENCNDENSCVAFATSKGIAVSTEYKMCNEGEHTDGAFAGANYNNGESIKKNATLVIYKWKVKVSVVVPDFTGDIDGYVKTLSNLGLSPRKVAVTEGATESNNGLFAGVYPNVGSAVEAGKAIDVFYYSYSAPIPENPSTETPGTETPGTETPGTETPGTETPGTETPGTDTPGDGGTGDGGETVDDNN